MVSKRAVRCLGARRQNAGLGSPHANPPPLFLSIHSNKFEKCRKEQAAFEDKLPATK